ncbi:hypothetical protein VPHK120G1_0003 [Vibrio phage K120 g1]
MLLSILDRITPLKNHSRYPPKACSCLDWITTSDILLKFVSEVALK